VRPIIAVTCDRRAAGPERTTAMRVRPGRPEVFVGEAVVNLLRASGARVILLPPGGDASDGLELAHGVVVTGGAFDIHPAHYGQEVRGRLDRVDEERTGLELALARGCLERGVPILGLCGGMQAIAVAAGGTLVQDIAADVPGALPHEQPTDPAETWHPLVTRDPRLPGAVNSTHHQAVADPGVARVIARAPDGVVEAVEVPGHPFAVGVQWHPELLADDRLFRALVAAAGPR
jgi:putative glutamine amidotransferase